MVGLHRPGGRRSATSTASRAAYGIAVTGTMVITSLIFYACSRASLALALAAWRARFLALFFCIDARRSSPPTSSSSSTAAGCRSRSAVGLHRDDHVEARRACCCATGWSDTHAPLEHVPRRDAEARARSRVPGTAVFMTSSRRRRRRAAAPLQAQQGPSREGRSCSRSSRPTGSPRSRRPTAWRSRSSGRASTGSWRTTASWRRRTFRAILRRCEEKGLKVAPEQASYFLGRETILATGRSKLSHWRKLLFIYMSRNARPANAFFRIPSNRVVELGAQCRALGHLPASVPVGPVGSSDPTSGDRPQPSGGTGRNLFASRSCRSCWRPACSPRPPAPSRRRCRWWSNGSRRRAERTGQPHRAHRRRAGPGLGRAGARGGRPGRRRRPGFRGRGLGHRVLGRRRRDGDTAVLDLPTQTIAVTFASASATLNASFGPLVVVRSSSPPASSRTSGSTSASCPARSTCARPRTSRCRRWSAGASAPARRRWPARLPGPTGAEVPPGDLAVSAC